jgi:cytidylate kinase
MDGPSGSGKSSTSRGVATRLGLRYLDTGAMYRAMTWWLLKHDVDVEDPEAVAAHADAPLLLSGTDPHAPTIGRRHGRRGTDPRARGDLLRQRGQRRAADP